MDQSVSLWELLWRVLRGKQRELPSVPIEGELGTPSNPFFVPAPLQLTDEQLKEIKKTLAQPGIVVPYGTSDSPEVRYVPARFTLDELLEKYGPEATLGDIKAAQEFQEATQDPSPPKYNWADPFQFMGRLSRDTQEKLTPIKPRHPWDLL